MPTNDEPKSATWSVLRHTVTLGEITEETRQLRSIGTLIGRAAETYLRFKREGRQPLLVPHGFFRERANVRDDPRRD